ncbi:MAG: PAS domain-containing sensor histidine kinase [Terriglobales bacterium]
MRTFGELSSDGVFLADEGGEIFYFSARAQQLAGLSAADAAGSGWLRFVDPAERERVADSWRAAVAAGAGWQDQWRWTSGAPARRTRCSAQPVRNAAGAIQGYLGVISDTTEAQRAVSRAQIFAALPDPICIANLKTGRYEQVNPAFEQILGYTAAEILACPIVDWVYPDDRTLAADQLAALRRGVPMTQWEVRQHHKDGGYRWIVWHTCRIGDTDTAFALGREVTAEKQIGQAQRRLSLLAEHTEDIIEMAAIDGHVTYLNRAGRVLLGWDTLDPGATLAGFLAPARRDEQLAAIRARQLQGEGWEGEIEFYNRQTGELVPVHAKAFAIRDPGGQPAARAFIARDMRAWRQAEARLRQAESMAAMGRVAAVIAHEINNPLAAAVNQAYLLRHSPRLPPAAREWAEGIASELARVSAVAKQTLDYYREPRNSTPVPLAEVISGVLGSFTDRMILAKIRLQTALDNKVCVQGSLNQLRQVLINLVGNAIDAMPAGGALCIRLYASHSWGAAGVPGARVTVADTGPGIAPADHRRIFEPFFSTKGNAGTGLGLWISQEIIRQHGGTLQVRNGPAGGACFHLFLPTNQPPASLRT